MKHRWILAALLVSVAAPLVGAQTALADPGDGHGKVVFVQTNEASGNRILAYDRGDDGQLTLAGSYATGATAAPRCRGPSRTGSARRARSSTSRRTRR